MSAPRILCVHAHPDDESLWTGGLIARSTAVGAQVDVVMGTWGEGTTRHGELLDAMSVLGVTRPPIMLGYADDKVPESAPGRPRFCDAPFREQVRELTAHIRGLRPDVIVTYDPVGIYGHPDHVHAHRLACAAADAAAWPTVHRRLGEPWQVRSLYFATIPVSTVDGIADDLFAGIPRENLPGTPAACIDLRLDVSDLVDRKAAAIAAHRTEVVRSQTISMLMSLDHRRRSELLGEECYLRRDLVAGGSDLV